MTQDLTRVRKNAYKREINSSVAHILFSDVVDGTAHALFELPANALIINAGILVSTVANGAITVNLGFTGGSGVELGSALDIHTSTGWKQTPPAIALTSGALTGTLTSGLVSGATTVVQNLNITGTVTTLTGTETPAPRIDTVLGKEVIATFSAVPTQGDFHVIVEYIEYTLTDGDMTNYKVG